MCNAFEPGVKRRALSPDGAPDGALFLLLRFCARSLPRQFFFERGLCDRWRVTAGLDPVVVSEGCVAVGGSRPVLLLAACLSARLGATMADA